MNILCISWIFTSINVCKQTAPMDIYHISWLFVLSIAIWITSCEGQCEQGEIFEDGKCFDSLSVARNLVLEWEWFYPINVEFTSQVETNIRDYVIAEVIKFSEDMRDLDLSRPFCPDPTCSTLNLEFRLSPNEQRLWCTFRLEDINNLLSEAPPLTAPTALQDAVGEGRFNLGEPNDLDSNGQTTNYDLLSNTRYCDLGAELLGSGGSSLCGVCARGFYGTVDRVCHECEIGTYQEDPGMLNCTQCQPPLSTLNDESRSVDDCILVCEAGSYANEAGTECIECPFGEYNSNRGQTRCFECSSGRTTFTTGSSSILRCTDPCDPGYKLTLSGECEICPQGTYLEEPFSVRECTPCPDGLTTASDGAGSSDECNVAICAAGEFSASNNPGECTPCPVNTYKTAEMTQCASCGDASMWLTDDVGSTSQDDCRFYCGGGSFISSSGESCESCPHDSYKGAEDLFATQCTPCPDSAPKTASSGSTSVDSCQYARCERGYEISAGNPLQCAICDHGFYQAINEPIFQRCQACDEGKSTREQGAVSSTQCEEFCESGYERTVIGDCIPCQRAFYKDNSEGIEELFGECKPCPVDFITSSVASTSVQDCSVRNCSLGYFLHEEDNLCRICERGTYQDELYRTSCKSCPDETTTVGDGATREIDCSVIVGRVRYAFRIKFNLEWRQQYFNPDSNLYGTLENRILKQVDRALRTGVGGYREGLRLRSLSPGSVEAHLVALFYEDDPDLEAEIEQTLNNAVSSEQLSDREVDGTSPLPIDPRATDPFAFGLIDRDFCERGQRYNYDISACEPCPVGWYQMETLADVCLQCQDGYSTEDEATVGEEADVCKLICDAGFEDRNGACRECAEGYYKESAGVESCDECVGSLITVATGSTTADACIAPCPAGSFSNDIRRCEECPRDTYNEDENQTGCTECPEFLGTLGTGASSSAECVDDCVSNNPCLNAATCVFNNNDGTISCACAAAFTGNLCEQRISTTQEATSPTTTLPIATTPSNGTGGATERAVSSKDDDDGNMLLYVAIGVPCAVVLIVVIIVVVACSRRNKKADPNPEDAGPKDIGLPQPPPPKKSNKYSDIPMNGLSPPEPPYTPASEDSFIVTTPKPDYDDPAPDMTSHTSPTSPSQKRRSTKDTVSSIPDVLAPQPPRAITTVNIRSDSDEIRHNRGGSASAGSRGQHVASGFDPVPDNFAMPTISNPLLMQQEANNNGSVFINGVATLPPASGGGAYGGDYPPPYSPTDNSVGKNGKKKKKGRKSKNSKHVLIDTQRNMVHTFKSTNSDTSSAFASPNGMPISGGGRNRPGLDTVRSDGSGVYETIPGDALL